MKMSEMRIISMLGTELHVNWVTEFTHMCAVYLLPVC